MYEIKTEFFVPHNIRRFIPEQIKQLPGVRSINALHYSVEQDLVKKSKLLNNTFPQGFKADDEQPEYNACHVLAMSARVGSTALLSTLQSGGLSDGKIREIFNNRGHTKNLLKQLNSQTMCGYLNDYAKQCGNDRLAFKIGWWDLAPLLHTLGDNFDSWFPNTTWVYLERRDKVAQAYSLWKAVNHGVWHKQKGDSYVCPPISDIPVSAIRDHIRWISLENKHWKRFFFETGIPHTCIEYEDFLSSPIETAQKAYFGFTGEDMSGDYKCAIIKSSDATDLDNVEKLRKALSPLKWV